MNSFIRFIELALHLSTEDFNDQLNHAYENASTMHEMDFGHVDESLVPKGIGIAYHNNKKKKIKFIVYCPSLVLDDDLDEAWKPTPGNVSRLIHKLGKIISKYFRSNYGLGDFDLNRIDFAADMDIGSREKVTEYIKVLHGVGRVKGFSPIKYDKHDGISKNGCFALIGNSNGIEFHAHSLKHEKKLLRAEVHLMTKDVIRAYSDETDSIEQIRVLAEKNEHIFMDTFQHIVPQGDFYKKPKAENLIYERVSDVRLRRRMLYLLALIPERKSLLLAQKALNCRKIGDVMAAFEEIRVSPVTIGKRRRVKRLGSLHGLLESKFLL